MKKPLPKFRSTEEALKALFSAAAYMGWGVAVPNGQGDAPVRGLVVGTEEYIESVLRESEE